MIEAIGWIGSSLLALCAVPQLWKCVTEGHANGVSGWFLAMWFFGEVFAFIYTFVLYPSAYALFFNYGINLLCLIVIILYKRPAPTVSTNEFPHGKPKPKLELVKK